MTFANKTAIVTGAGGGMGLNIARDLLAAGAHVTMIDLKPEPPADLPDGRARYLIGDVTEDTFVFKAVAQAYQETGRLDYLVNAAGVLWFGRDKSLVEIDLDLWDKILTIDLKSMVITARHAVPFMQKTGGGSMVHISSIQCLRGDDKPQDAYQASKAAMLALSKSLAIQFAADKIRSNCILPGPVESPMQDRWRENPAQKNAVAGAVPLGRVGTTQDMTDAVLFLLSDKASYITGTELIVDGGLTARP
jgi:NAD(P)-dependent dehydrogenase (short-subunit alcohol dehydrogenase family)